ncbi:MAG: patatin-like phospholipase family protein [Candidatus Dadabacteria bacterium]|nr:patatin-like phospholipase family protein [Candidatus Dadabacteria bacterium]
MEQKTRFFRILSLDGGGIRGIFSARVLDLMNDKLGINTYNTFDLLVGTSTGSIVAAAVATRYNLSKLVQDYECHAPRIFKKRFPLCGFLRSRYDNEILENLLHESFGEITLGDIKTPLIINATNVSTGKVHVFKSSYQEERRGGDYSRDGDVPLYKAVLASCSAPVYFDPVEISGDLVCDGGLWANNPALVGYVDAVRNFNKAPANTRILSIGTGNTRQFYLPSYMWGLVTGWKKEKIVNFAMLSQTQYAENCLSLIMPENVLRINPEIENWDLDDYKVLPTLKSLASREVTNRGELIKEFLQ